MSAPPVPVDPSACACANCSTPFTLPRPNYCPHCGQETHLKPPTLMEFAKQFGGNYVSTEGALWRTLALLLLRPGRLTAQYLAGRRRRYVLPLRLFLTISLLVLLLLRWLAPANVWDDTEAGANAVKFERPANATVLTLGQSAAGVKDGVFYCHGLPAFVCKRLRPWVEAGKPEMKREVEALLQRVLANLGGAMFVLLPSFALWLKLVYFNRRLRYTEHLVFALHVHAFWFVMLAIALTSGAWVATLALLAVPIYTWLALGHVYRDRRWPRLLRASLVALLYGLSLSFAALGVGLWSLLF